MYSKDNDKERVMHSKSNNAEMMNNDKDDGFMGFMNFLNHFFLDIKLLWKHR